MTDAKATFINFSSHTLAASSCTALVCHFLMKVTLLDLFLSLIPYLWPTGSGLKGFLLTDLRLAREFNPTVNLSFQFLLQELHTTYVSGK